MDWLIGKSRRNKEVVSLSNQNLKLYLRQDFVRERLIEGDFSALVALPRQVDYNEWLASNSLSFFEHINALWGCLTEFCKPTTPGCLSMTGPGNVQYLWVDDRGKKFKCTAAQYIDYGMSFAQKCVSDENIFPTKYGNPFPSSFEKIVRKIHRLLFHVLAHIYQCHCREVTSLYLRSHLNTVTFHFLLFNRHFNLIENKETNVLGDLFERLQHSQRPSDLLPQNVSNPKEFVDDSSSNLQSLQKPTSRIQSVRPFTLREKEQNGFIRESLAPCALVT